MRHSDNSTRGSKGIPRKSIPPDDTHAETFYYAKQRERMTPMVIVLVDGEKLFGTIKWYDRNGLKLCRDRLPEIMIPKCQIKYLYKDEEPARETLC